MKKFKCSCFPNCDITCDGLIQRTCCLFCKEFQDTCPNTQGCNNLDFTPTEALLFKVGRLRVEHQLETVTGPRGEPIYTEVNLKPGRDNQKKGEHED